MNAKIQETLARLQRIEILYTEVKETPLPPLQELRFVLFDAGASTAEKERALLALIDHPDPEALLLLEHRALSFHHARLSFTHEIARRRRRAKSLSHTACTGADAA